MNVPGWLRDAIATPRGFISKKGELLKAVRMTAAQCDEFNNRKKAEPKQVNVDMSTPVPTVSEEPEVEVVEDQEIEITVAGADSDGDGELDEEELRRLTKAKLENIGRDYGIELDRRKSKETLLQELIEAISNK